MKIDFAAEHPLVHGPVSFDPMVAGETDRLTDVVLCGPYHLEAVPCCSVTQESIRNGFSVSMTQARAQHAALLDTLSRHGVRCHSLPTHPDFADQCFTRDAAVATPWGLVGLNPCLPHRAREVDHLFASLGHRGIRAFDRITEGTIEGGDVCIVRPGLLIVGASGARTTAQGAAQLAALFERHGWEVLRYDFDPHFLHLDTMFCMLDPQTALACVDVLDDGFLAAVAARGIELVPVSYKEARRLQCNIVSLDGRTILASTAPTDATKPESHSVADRIRRAGFDVIELDISQFAACGGGIHCLTMPLRRERV